MKGLKKLVEPLKMILLLTLLIFMYAFSYQRHKSLPIADIAIEFHGERRPFLTRAAVNKLLIQNQRGSGQVGKEILALNTMESALSAHPMIVKANVFVTVGGVLHAAVEQRTPIARWNAENPFYLDRTGAKMPLSPNYAARVLWINHVDPSEIDQLFPLVDALQKDAFMSQIVTSIGYDSKQGTKQGYRLHLRSHKLLVDFGDLTHIDRKITNFKAFYKQVQIEKRMAEFERVNLQYINQVVCKKKRV